MICQKSEGKRQVMSELKEYLLSDLHIGQTESFSVTVTERMQELFLEITNDINPMHADDTFARKRGFKGKLVYGMLTASFFSTLVGVYLPGKYCLFHECDVQWPRPVYIGDKLTISGKIEDISDTLNIIAIKATIVNQDNEKVARAKLTVEVKTHE